MCLVIKKDTKPTKIRKDRKVFKILTKSDWKSANREFQYQAGKNYVTQIKESNNPCHNGERDSKWINENYGSDLKWFGEGFHFYTKLCQAEKTWKLYQSFGSGDMYMIVEFIIPAIRFPEIYINKETELGITNQIFCTDKIVK